MTQGIYVIYDNVAQRIITALMMFSHVAAAIRSFHDLAQDPNTMVGRHLQDHDLYQVGIINEDTRELTAHHELIISGKALAASKDAAAKATAHAPPGTQPPDLRATP